MWCPSLHLLRTPSSVRATTVCRRSVITPILQQEQELTPEWPCHMATWLQVPFLSFVPCFSSRQLNNVEILKRKLYPEGCFGEGGGTVVKNVHLLKDSSKSNCQKSAERWHKWSLVWESIKRVIFQHPHLPLPLPSIFWLKWIQQGNINIFFQTYGRNS